MWCHQCKPGGSGTGRSGSSNGPVSSGQSGVPRARWLHLDRSGGGPDRHVAEAAPQVQLLLCGYYYGRSQPVRVARFMCWQP